MIREFNNSDEMQACIGKEVRIVNCYELYPTYHPEVIIEKVAYSDVRPPYTLFPKLIPPTIKCFHFIVRLKNTLIMHVHPNCVDFFEDDIKKVKTYPNICKKCKSPCRKKGKLTICSSNKCSTNHRIKTFLFSKQDKKNQKNSFSFAIREVNDLGIVLCPKCANKASKIDSNFTIKCICGFSYNHLWKNGEGYMLSKTFAHICLDFFNASWEVISINKLPHELLNT